jgi:hypothetical protein
VHDGKIEAFLVDLDASLAEVADQGASGDIGAYGTVD